MTEETNAKEKPRMKDIPRDVQPYFVALLSRGERWNDTHGPDRLTWCLASSRSSENRWKQDVTCLPGPITGNGPLVGISIIAAGTAAEAREIADADPGVRSGHLRVEIHSAYLPSLQNLKVNYS